MSRISSGLADCKWQDMLAGSDPAVLVAVQDSLRIIGRDSDNDLVVNALVSHHWTRRASIADAFAFTVFRSLVEQGRILMALRPAASWAVPDRQVERNHAAFAPAEVTVHLSNGPGGYDGQLQPTRPLALRQLDSSDDDTPPSPPVVLLDDGFYPVEVGDCSMSKCVAMLAMEGRLARLPYGLGLERLTPRVYFFALRGPAGGIEPASHRVADYASNQTHKEGHD